MIDSEDSPFLKEETHSQGKTSESGDIQSGFDRIERLLYIFMFLLTVCAGTFAMHSMFLKKLETSMQNQPKLESEPKILDMKNHAIEKLLKQYWNSFDAFFANLEHRIDSIENLVRNSTESETGFFPGPSIPPIQHPQEYDPETEKGKDQVSSKQESKYFKEGDPRFQAFLSGVQPLPTKCAELPKVNAVRNSNFSEITSLISETAGIYKDKDKSCRFRDTVLLVSVSDGYWEFAANWMGYADTYGWKYIFGALDKKIYDRFKDKTPHIFDFTKGWENLPGYAQYTKSKIFLALEILRMGFNIFMMDVDIGFFPERGDPFDYVYKGCDLQAQQNLGANWSTKWGHRKTEINTGFYFARSAPNVIKLFEDIVSIKGVDQYVLRDIMKESPDRFEFAVPFGPMGRILRKAYENFEKDGKILYCFFPNDVIRTKCIGLIVNETIAYHVNCVPSKEKKQILKDAGTWRFGPPETESS